MQRQMPVCKYCVNIFTLAQITPEERAAVQKELSVLMTEWRKRKRWFKELFGMVTEGIDTKQSKLYVSSLDSIEPN